MVYKRIALSLLFPLLCLSPLSAEENSSLAEAAFAKGVAAYKRKEWVKASAEFEKAIANSPSAAQLRQEALFYLAVAQYESQHFEEANKALSCYFSKISSPEQLELVLKYKFAIAEALRCRVRQRSPVMGFIGGGRDREELALKIYDEIILIGPNSPLVPQVLDCKAFLLARSREFPEAIRAYQRLIHLFPDSPLAPPAYASIVELYFLQGRSDGQNLEFLLTIARLTCQRFERDYPDAGLALVRARSFCNQIAELCAHELWRKGHFYERTEAPCSAVLYYSIAARRFPDTTIGALSRSRLEALARYVPSCCAL